MKCAVDFVPAACFVLGLFVLSLWGRTVLTKGKVLVRLCLNALLGLALMGLYWGMTKGQVPLEGSDVLLTGLLGLPGLCVGMLL